MPRQPKPWRRRGVGGSWYSTIAGEKVWLAPTEATKTEAQNRLTAELAARQFGTTVRRGSLLVRDVINLYLKDRLDAVERGDMEANSRLGTVRFLEPFERSFGKLAVPALKVGAAEAWVASRANWNVTTRARATEMVKACFRWAKRAGHIEANPLEQMVGPKPRSREAILSREQFQKILEATTPEFRDYLLALLYSGCRPIEVFTLTADRVDLESGTWKVRDKIRGKTGVEFRTVYLNEPAIQLSKRWLELNPEGILFTNSIGNPWRRERIGHNMRRLAIRLGYGRECVAYSARHLFATDLLEKGVPPATVAELLGHRSLQMVMRIYNHLKKRTEHLRDAVKHAGGGSVPPFAA